MLFLVYTLMHTASGSPIEHSGPTTTVEGGMDLQAVPEVNSRFCTSMRDASFVNGTAVPGLSWDYQVATAHIAQQLMVGTRH